LKIREKYAASIPHSSAISLMETIVSIVKDKTGLGRIPCCLIVLGICLLLGLPSSLGYSVWSNVKILGMQILDFFDFISNSVLMPLVALVTCVFVGYVLKPGILMDEVSLSGKFKKKKLFTFIIKYVAPICIVLILGFSVLEGLGYIKV
jgi:NSS family neurotransmitter:Na+ symporter